MELINTVKRQAIPWIRKLIADPQLLSIVTYRRFSGQVFDSAQGHNVNTFDDFPLTGIETQHTKESLDVSTRIGIYAKLQVGDRVFIFISDEMPSGVSLKDVVVSAGGIEYEIKSIMPIYGIVHFVIVGGSE